MSSFISRRQLLGGLAVGSALPGSLWAQTAWPTRPVKVVVPYPAGGSPDLFARVVARELSNIYAQPFNVDNKPGAAALIGARAVSQNPTEIHAMAYITSGHVTGGFSGSRPAALNASLLYQKTVVELLNGKLNI